MKKRKKWLVIGGVLLVLSLYVGTYLCLRVTHVFIHRAGRYDSAASKYVDSDTNHFVEPGQVMDGPEMFVTAIVAATDEHGDLEPDNVDLRLEELIQEVDRTERGRARLFVVFRPAAFLETVCWKIVDPDPYGRIGAE